MEVRALFGRFFWRGDGTNNCLLRFLGSSPHGRCVNKTRSHTLQGADKANMVRGEISVTFG